jgi:hypothetical protein
MFVRRAVLKDRHSALARIYTRNLQAGICAGTGENNSGLTAIDSIHGLYESGLDVLENLYSAALARFWFARVKELRGGENVTARKSEYDVF